MTKRKDYLFMLASAVFLIGLCRQEIDNKGISAAVRKVLYQSVIGWHIVYDRYSSKIQ